MGKAGQGASNLRQFIIEQDLLEAIVAIPEKMFYNTDIGTYLWVITNKKATRRKGKVQLIDATSFKSMLRKNLGEKCREITSEIKDKILEIYLAFDSADQRYSRVIDNCEFGYWEVPIIHPLYDEDGNVVYETKGKNKGKPKGDKALTEKARVPFSYENGIDGFYETEVKPYSPDAWINKTEIKVGYEISFTKYFYNPDELQDTLAIISDLESKHSQTSSFLQKIISEAQLSQQSTSIILQDSGNRFLGRIPAHWKLVNLWQICSEQKNKNKDNQESNVLSLSQGNIIRKKDLNFGLVPKDYEGYQIVEPGNIILRLTDLQNDQKSLRTALVRERGIITSAYVCLKTSQNPRFIQLILHVYDINKYFYGLGGGVRQSIGFQDLRNMTIPIPPMEEQNKIAEFVDTKSAAVGEVIDEMMDALRAELALLGQYKTQMSADIITGRSDISSIHYTEKEYTPHDVNEVSDNDS